MHFEQKLQRGNTKQGNWPPGIAYRLIIPRCNRLLFSNHVLCENTSLLPPTLLQPELTGPYAPSFHSVDVIFSRVLYDFFLCLLSGACVPRHFYLFSEDTVCYRSSFDNQSHCSTVPRPSLPLQILITRNDSINKRENNNRLNCNKLPLLAMLILVVALFHVLGAHRPANNSSPSKFFFSVAGWLAR